jgi:hypothetical protein
MAMKLSQALVRRKELVLKKNALEERLEGAQAYKVHMESKEVMERLYSDSQFDDMTKKVADYRTEIEGLKKRICKGNQQLVPGHVKCVQDLVIEIGTLKDTLSFLGKLRSKCQEDRYERQDGVATKTVMNAGDLDSLIDTAQLTINGINKEISEINAQIEI